ncbi:hypothetical protein Naga_102237g1, partial [Nannochloropsis gaditana]
GRYPAPTLPGRQHLAPLPPSLQSWRYTQTRVPGTSSALTWSTAMLPAGEWLYLVGVAGKGIDATQVPSLPPSLPSFLPFLLTPFSPLGFHRCWPAFRSPPSSLPPPFPPPLPPPLPPPRPPPRPPLTPSTPRPWKSGYIPLLPPPLPPPLPLPHPPAGSRSRPTWPQALPPLLPLLPSLPTSSPPSFHRVPWESPRLA